MLKGSRKSAKAGGDFLNEVAIRQKEVRKEALSKRDALAKEQVLTSSAKIAEQIVKLPEFFNEQTVFAYSAFRNEVDLSNVIRMAQEHGKALLLPKTKDSDILFYEYGPDDRLVPGRFGVLEPEQDTPADPKNGLMLVPGVAFSKEGYRIGFGKGYYDRYLADRQMIITAGVCYEFQLSDHFPVKNSDIPMDMIITEEQIYYF